MGYFRRPVRQIFCPTGRGRGDIFWFDGLWGERSGDYIRKPMCDCTGEEVLQEFLYLSMLDWYDRLAPHLRLSEHDAPTSPANSCPAAAAETAPASFRRAAKTTPSSANMWNWRAMWCSTVETSVRTAMMAAYGLTGIDRKVLPLYQGQYDIRWLVMCMKKMLGTDKIKYSDLPPLNPLI